MRAGTHLGLALCVAFCGAAMAQEAAVPPIAESVLPAPEDAEEQAGGAAAVGMPNPAETLTAEAAAFRDGLAAALGGEASREAILTFYEGRGFTPFWSDEGRAARLEVLIAAIEAHGLPPARYAELLDDAGETGPVQEAAMSRAYLRLAQDLSRGLLTPSDVDGEINLRPREPGPDVLMARLDGGALEAALEGAAPQAPEYRALIDEKARLESLGAAGGWGATVPEGPTLHEGDRDQRVPALRARLERLGYSAAAAQGDDATLFDAGLAATVAQFQRDYGLLDDGAAGARTLAALNASVDDRIGQVLVNLERLRWLGDLGERYVLVNIPDYATSVYEDGERVYHTRSVVGQTSTQTPEFSETMTYLVVNPTWYLPDSIAKRVYLPKLRTDPGVIARSNMRLFTRSGTEIDPALVDFSRLEDGAFPFRVRQNPSPENALGKVKFMFPNQFAIYLHDTPAKELFDRDARAFSNGCVRLEDPFAFAHYLLAPQLEDPEATFALWVEAGSERHVTLERPIQVHITYRSAWVDPDGGAQYRSDVYGRDRRVLAALAERGVSIPGPRG